MANSKVKTDEEEEAREKKAVLIKPDNISVITDFENGLGYVNDQDNKQINSFEVLDDTKIIYKKLVLRCCISSAAIHENQYTGTKKYQICSCYQFI